MSKMLRKRPGSEYVCMYGEKCCAPYPMGGRSMPKTKKMQRRRFRRVEDREWRKDQ